MALTATIRNAFRVVSGLTPAQAEWVLENRTDLVDVIMYDCDGVRGDDKLAAIVAEINAAMNAPIVEAIEIIEVVAHPVVAIVEVADTEEMKIKFAEVLVDLGIAIHKYGKFQAELIQIYKDVKAGGWVAFKQIEPRLKAIKETKQYFTH